MSLSQVMPLEKTALEKAEDDRLELAVREHARLVYRIAFSVLRNHHDAEDATQETFLRLLRYGKKMPEVREIKSWIARIAWRVAVSRKKKMPDISLDDADAGAVATQLQSLATGAEETLLHEEMSGVLEKLIATLPRKLREPLTLSTVQELSTATIADVLGTSEAAVRSCLFRARQVLRDRLTDLWDSKHEPR
ncbi:MAG: RNA polymerase sigma factor [Terriglobales bacterium]